MLKIHRDVLRSVSKGLCHFSTLSLELNIKPWERTCQLLAGVLEGNRANLAEAITLVESKHPDKHKQSQWLLTSLLAHRNRLIQLGKLKESFRIGLSGAPGSGKSTLIETMGKILTSQQHKVAVLAVDPSSSRTGGSILGDKTRMPKLASDPLAYIRPSPSGGNLGGVARNTQEAVLLCEGAGYDVIMVETVGVGQSETAVADMVDMFVLLVPPAAGDELQGLKKGIVEIADIVVITKADGDLLPAARRIQTEYLSALKLIRRALNYPWRPRVLRVSSLENEGIEELWDTMKEFHGVMKDAGEFENRRSDQQRTWLWTHLQWQIMHRFQSDVKMFEAISEAEEKVKEGKIAPGTASDWLIDSFLNRQR